MFELEPRYGHTLHYFKNFLVVHGGAGRHINKLKSR
jgi:hypothetical protein